MEKILVIDDEKLQRMTLRRTLVKEGYEVAEAENGEEGLKLIRKLRPDVVITDFQMPGLDGLELLDEINRLHLNLPVIMLTAYDEVALTIKSVQLGAFEFLEKPVSAERLRDTVQKALASVQKSQDLEVVVFEKISQVSTEDNMLLVGKTPRMKKIFKNIGRISMNKVNILIQGETGTGKEMIARLIHFSGFTREKPLVVVNCSALTETLLESELFGHVKGAFTGSVRDKKGKFELAGEGTIFLDEISEMSLNTQVKLLRVLQELEFEKVGGEETIPMKARIITATNRSLEKLIQEGKFREDLYYRLKVFTIDLPPLRERTEDIPELVHHFLIKLNKRFNKQVTKIGEGVMEMLQQHDWYGNVRELENTILQAVVMSKNDVLSREDISLNSRLQEQAVDPHEAGYLRSLEDVEKFHIKRILDETNWSKLEAARILGITRPTLNAKIEKYGLEQGVTEQ